MKSTALLSRRAFGAMASGAAFVLGGCGGPDRFASGPTAPPPTVDRLRAASKHVVVVGAGLGGLAAALRLRGHGFRVTVLERSDRAGGRVRSIPLENFAIEANGARLTKLQDVGAQFLNDRYATLMALIAASDTSVVPLLLSKKSVTVRDGRAITIDAERPASIYQRGLLDLIESARVKYAYDEVSHDVAGLPLDDYAAWTKFDRGLASAWLDANYGRTGARYLGDPAIESYFFHAPDETSQALFHWIIANHATARAWFTMAGHTQSIPAALQQKLVREGGVVHLEREVVSVARDSNGRVRVSMSDGEALDVDGCIVATTSPVSRAIVKTPSPEQVPVLDNGYASTVVVNFHCEREHAPLHAQGRIGGVNIPRVERKAGVIAGFSVESGKYPDRALAETLRGHEVYGVHVVGRAARDLGPRPDDAIFDVVRRELNGYFPGILAHESSRAVMRWRDAVPMSAPGRTHKLAALWRAQRDDDGTILLAGDQTTFGTMDAAARSGTAAADLLAAKLARAPGASVAASLKQ